MEQKKPKTIHQIMRGLHRDVGFFIIGLIVIFTLSGIVFIYRDHDFLKKDIRIEKTISPNLKSTNLGEALKIKEFKIIKTERNTIYFKDGSYNMTTGKAIYTSKELPYLVKKFSDIHKSNSKNPVHWFTTIFGILLLFLAISSMWMYKWGTKLFRRGIIVASAGILFTLLLFFL